MHQPTSQRKIFHRQFNAVYEQRRRREKRAPKIAARWPSLVRWVWPYENPFKWVAFHCATINGVFTLDDFVTGDQRKYEPDGGTYFMFIQGFDVAGNPCTAPSNIVQPSSNTDSLFSSMLGYWLMDEPGYFPRVDAVLERALVEYNLDAQLPLVDRCDGLNQGAALFDGESGNLLLAQAAWLTDFSICDNTIAFWFKYSTGPYENQTLLNVGGGYCLSLNEATSALTAYMTTSHTSGSWTLTTDDRLSEGEWHHCAITRAGSYCCWFYDGVAVTDGVANGDYINALGGSGFGVDDVQVGCSGYGYPLNGAIDNLGLWTRALSSAEISRLFNSGAGLGPGWVGAP